MSPLQYLGLAGLWALVGAVLGSFLNLVADRLPSDQSVVHRRSRCPACGRQLGVLELVPVASYLLLRGRCQSCGAPIPVRVLTVELAAAAICGGMWLAYGPTLQTVIVGVYLLLFLLLTVIDLEHHLLPNRLIYPAMVLSVAALPLRAEITLWQAVLGGLLGGGLLAVPLLLKPGAMGMGDLKMAALVGLVTGLPSIAVALFAAVVCGGMVAGGLLLAGRVSRRDSIPFGPFLAFGGGVGLLYGQSIWTWYTRGW